MALVLFSMQFKTVLAAVCACISGGLTIRTSGIQFVFFLLITALLIFLAVNFLLHLPKA